MNKKIGTGLAVVVIALGAYFVFGSKNKPNDVLLKNEKTAVEEAQVKSENQAKSLKDLVMAGRPQKCSFSQVVENSESSGTYYISGKKVRGDYNVKVSEQNVVGHMLLDGSTVYTWSDGQKEGFKMEITESPNTESMNPEQKNVNIEQKLDYKCESWKADEEVFVLPKEVSFKSLNEMSAKVPVMSGENAKGMQCEACNNVPQESRQQCKQALNCK